MLNHLDYQGRMVDDIKFGQTNGGTDYANFRLAWSEKYKERENKCFLDCKAFGGTASFINKYLGKKGQEMIVTGKMNTEEWEKDGQKRSRVVLLVDSVHFCGSRKDSGEQGTAAQAAESPDAPADTGFTPVETDELPF